MAHIYRWYAVALETHGMVQVFRFHTLANTKLDDEDSISVALAANGLIPDPGSEVLGLAFDSEQECCKAYYELRELSGAHDRGWVKG